MKRLTFLILVICIFTALMVASTFASGWKWDSTDPSTSPHLGFSTSTNQCKVCHAIHSADGSSNEDYTTESYRLLRDNTRDSECNFCHLATTGLSGMKMYDIPSNLVNAQHRVAAVNSNAPAEGSAIPGSTGGSLEDGSQPIPEKGSASNKFNCFHCHAVHGANRIEESSLNSKIVLKDPAANGGTAVNEGEFCGDCHNKNKDSRDYQNDRYHGPTHPMKTFSSDYEVYGADSQVAWKDSINCRDCHQSTKTNNTDPDKSEYPHQSKGYKFLADNNDGSNLDEVCIGCHRNPLDVNNDGVGKTF